MVVFPVNGGGGLLLLKVERVDENETAKNDEK
jgi:hypothetical protein